MLRVSHTYVKQMGWVVDLSMHKSSVGCWDGDYELPQLKPQGEREGERVCICSPCGRTLGPPAQWDVQMSPVLQSQSVNRVID